MQFNQSAASAAELKTPCLVVGVSTENALPAPASALDSASDGRIARMIASGDIQCKAGKTTLVHGLPGVAAERILFVGTGDSKEFDGTKFHQAALAAGRFLRQHSTKEAASALHQVPVTDRDEAWCLKHSAIQFGHANYVYDTTKPAKDGAPPPLDSMTFLADEAEKPALAQAHAIASGFITAKELANLPPNICNPEYLANHCRSITARFDRCSIEVLDREQMTKLGMNALLAVSKGSACPPYLAIMKYEGGGDADPVVLVGKGITFDTGGISLKPGENMDQMKYDMGGAASVIGTFESCARMQLDINLIVMVAAVENMPDGAAYRPGDVITSMSGQTIEVLNTDAEGRMILCDALTYAERYHPAALIDVATLTGACVVALGHHASGLMSKTDALAEELIDAGLTAVDRAWRLPLWDEYQQQLDTPFAEMKNVGGMPAGSVTAGCFLSRFTKGQKWAHLDIAGSAWKWASQDGATGRPVGLLSQFLINRANN